MVPSGSVDPDPLKFTANGASPEAGLAVKLALGGWLGTGAVVTWISLVEVSVPPSSSVTVRVAV